MRAQPKSAHRLMTMTQEKDVADRPKQTWRIDGPDRPTALVNGVTRYDFDGQVWRLYGPGLEGEKWPILAVIQSGSGVSVSFVENE